MDGEVTLEPLPFDLRWHSPPADWSVDGGGLSITAGPRTDLFSNPQGTTPARVNAPFLVGFPEGDFLFSARLTVGFQAAFDAGALLVHAYQDEWAKLCFEYSPQGEAMVVSVVNRRFSDDCNSFVLDPPTVWLRIARMGSAFAFHASTDGTLWRFVRQFALEASDRVGVGFLAQAPTGATCTVTYDEIRFAAARLRNLRSGE